MLFVTSSFLFLVVWPGAPSSVPAQTALLANFWQILFLSSLGLQNLEDFSAALVALRGALPRLWIPGATGRVRRKTIPVETESRREQCPQSEIAFGCCFQRMDGMPFLARRGANQLAPRIGRYVAKRQLDWFGSRFFG